MKTTNAKLITRIVTQLVFGAILSIPYFKSGETPWLFGVWVVLVLFRWYQSGWRLEPKPSKKDDNDNIGEFIQGGLKFALGFLIVQGAMAAFYSFGVRGETVFWTLAVLLIATWAVAHFIPKKGNDDDDDEENDQTPTGPIMGESLDALLKKRRKDLAQSMN